MKTGKTQKGRKMTPDPLDLSNLNSGHGHVRPRPDGIVARCLGPLFCVVCQREEAVLWQMSSLPVGVDGRPLELPTFERKEYMIEYFGYATYGFANIEAPLLHSEPQDTTMPDKEDQCDAS